MTFRQINPIVLSMAVMLLAPLSSISLSDEKEGQLIENECVILLHGLCRGARSMSRIEDHLIENGYDVLNLDYASTEKPVETLAAEDIGRAVARCREKGYGKIHFVTHSMGGILVRCYLQSHTLPPGSRVVMLAPPNQGSELADFAMDHAPAVYGFGGPNAFEIGTASDALVSRLFPVQEDIGVIAGSRSWNPFFSSILPGDDDGKVSVARTRIPEMRDFMVVPVSHWMMLYNKNVHKQIIQFLETGFFDHGR